MSKYFRVQELLNVVDSEHKLDIRLERFAFKPSYTVGNLYINGCLFCDTMEDFDRGADNSMPFTPTGKNVGYWTRPDGSRIYKVYAETAIPTGTYGVHLAWTSFKRRLPLLEKVSGYTDILMHNGKTAKNSAGCILVGRNTIVGELTSSHQAMLDTCELFLLAEREDYPCNVTVLRRK